MKSYRNNSRTRNPLQNVLGWVAAQKIVALSLMLGCAAISSLAQSGTLQLNDANGSFIYYPQYSYPGYGSVEFMDAAGTTGTITMTGGGTGYPLVIMAGGSGTNTMIAGATSDIMTGGSGTMIFEIGAGAGNASSAYTIVNFTGSDSVILGGTLTASQMLASAQVVNGSTTLKLSNGATVTFDNVGTSLLQGHVTASSALTIPASGVAPTAVTPTGYTITGTSLGVLTTPISDQITNGSDTTLVVSGDSVAGLSITASGSDGFTLATAAGDLLAGQAGTQTITSSDGNFTFSGTVNDQTLTLGSNTHIITGNTNNLELDAITNPGPGDQIIVTGARFSAVRYDSGTGVLQLDTRNDGSYATSIQLPTGLADNFQAIEGAGADDYTTVTLPGTATLEVETTSLPGGTNNQEYSQMLTAFGGSPNYTWKVTAGALPQGITLSTDGLLAGKPTVIGTFDFTVEVTDASSATASQALAINLITTETTTSPPTLTVTSPKTGAKTSNDVFAVTGTASDKVAVTGVRYSLNDAAWASAMPGDQTWSSWSISADLTPGTNTLSIYAADSSGLDSKTNTLKLIYIVTATLSVSTNGDGTIKTDYNGDNLVVGENYSMTAKADKGFGLEKWTDGSDDFLTTNATLKFTMAADMSFIAWFVDIEKPTLKITSPKNNAKITGTTVTVTGTAADNVGVAGVWYQLNDGSWNEVSGLTNWTVANLAVVSGLNTLKAYAKDAAGNISATNTVSFMDTP